MTREETIKRLKEARFNVQPYQYINEALDMAIKALEQEPCEDAVSRQAVIDKSWELVYPDGTSERVVSVNDIEALLSVTPTQNISIQITEREKYGRFN